MSLQDLIPTFRTPVNIKSLVADTASSVATAKDATMQEIRDIVDYVQSALETGEEIMFTLDVPAVPAQKTPMVLAQAAPVAEGSNQQVDYLFKGCQETESTGDPHSAMRAVEPAFMLKNYLEFRDRKSGRLIDLASIKTTLLEGTKHGKMTSGVTNTGRVAYGYDAIPNYEGKDRAVFMAEFEGKRYKIIVDLRVFKVVDEYHPVCPKPQLIKVNKPQSSLDLNGVSVSLADIADGMLGQTTGTTIILDNNAAGYGWFIDSTPDQNEHRKLGTDHGLHQTLTAFSAWR